MTTGNRSSDKALSVRGVVKRYGNHVAVDGVSFEVPTGVIFGVLGPNGAGKSTTLRMINDIIAPDQGDIEILGRWRPGRDASAHIGYLPEERGLYPKMRVVEMIAFVGGLRGLSRREGLRRAHAWLEKLGLSNWEKNLVQDLSKGMQQKVQFACAAIHEPPLLILDEPWSGLDPINAEVLRAVVEEQKARGHTVLFSTHQMEQAEKICDEVCIIAHGQVVLAGNLADIKRSESSDRWVALEFADATDAARAEPWLRKLPLLAQVRGPRTDAAAALQVELTTDASFDALLGALANQALGVRRVERLTPSLHEIFVEHVGNARVAERRPSSHGGAPTDGHAPPGVRS